MDTAIESPEKTSIEFCLCADKTIDVQINGKTNKSFPFDRRNLESTANAITDFYPALSIGDVRNRLRMLREQTAAKDAERVAKLQSTYGLDRTWSLGELLASDIVDKYLVEHLLVEHQPCVIGGASKSLKTTFTTALALCIASGQDFLEFRTNDRRRVHFCSAESGKATTKKTILGLAKCLGIDLNDLIQGNWFTFDWWVPRSSNLEMMDCFKMNLEDSEAQVAIIDPLYLCLDDEQASQNENGKRLMDLVNPVLQMGALPIVLDHTKLSSANSKEHQPLELSDLSGAGKTNFFRQWLLLGRREKFIPGDDGTHQHRLWLTAGGSAGHAGQFAIDIEEANDSTAGRTYQMNMQSYREAIEGVKQNQQANRQSKAEEKEANHRARITRLAKQLIDNVYKGDATLSMSRNDIQDRLGCKGTETGEVIGLCLRNQSLKNVPESLKKNKQTYDGFMITGTIFSTGGEPWNA